MGFVAGSSYAYAEILVSCVDQCLLDFGRMEKETLVGRVNVQHRDVDIVSRELWKANARVDPDRGVALGQQQCTTGDTSTQT